MPSPVRRTYEIRLACFHEDYGNLCRKLGIRDKAASCFGRALAQWELLARADKEGQDRPEPWIEVRLSASRSLLDQAKH